MQYKEPRRPKTEPNDRLRWGVHHADLSAFERGRAAMRSGCHLVGVLEGPEAERVPARRFEDEAALFEACDVVVVGGPDAARTTRRALEAGSHVSAPVPLSYSSRAVLKLAHIARAQRRILHFFLGELYGPAFRTLSGHCRPGEIEELALEQTHVGDPMPLEPLLRAQLPGLQALTVLAGPVAEITRADFSRGRFRGTLVFRKGARCTLDFGPGDRDTRILRAHGDLKWRIEGSLLYCGNSMTTLTDTRSPVELGMLELEAVVGARGRPVLTQEAHYHTLVVMEALLAGRTGRLG